MTAAEAYQYAIIQIADAKTPALVLGSGKPKEPVSMNRVNMTQDVAADFTDIAKNAVPSPTDVQLLEYNASYKPDRGEVMHLSLSNDGTVKAIVDDLTAFQDVPLLKKTAHDQAIDNLRFYSMILGPKNGRAVLLRAVSERIEISKGHKMAALLTAGTFSKLTEKVFLFDRRVDCLAADEFLFVFNKSGFERLFQYYVQLKAHAAQAVKEVTKYIKIKNIEEFTEACTTQVRFMDKMASIVQQSYLPHITIADIKKVITEFNLPIPIVPDNGVEKIVFEPAPDKRWQILKLLDDDYLGSVMTHAKYAANSKIRVSS